MPSGGITDQKDKIEDLLTRKVDGIAVSPIDAANQTELLNKAAERTNLVTHDSDAPESNRKCYIGMDNYEAGLLRVSEKSPSRRRQGNDFRRPHGTGQCQAPQAGLD